MTEIKSKLMSSTRSKLMWFSLALVIAGVVEANLRILEQFMSPYAFTVTTVVTGIVIAIGRWMTMESFEAKLLAKLEAKAIDEVAESDLKP